MPLLVLSSRQPPNPLLLAILPAANSDARPLSLLLLLLLLSTPGLLLSTAKLLLLLLQLLLLPYEQCCHLQYHRGLTTVAATAAAAKTVAAFYRSTNRYNGYVRNHAGGPWQPRRAREEADCSPIGRSAGLDGVRPARVSWYPYVGPFVSQCVYLCLLHTA